MMANVSLSCIEEAMQALKEFSHDDLEQYVLDVLQRAREFPNLKGAAGIEKAIDEINNERSQLFMEQMQQQVNDKAKIAERENIIKDKKATLLQILGRTYKNFSDNVESSVRATNKILMDKFFNILTAEETKFLANDKNSIDIARALDGKDASELARSLAKKIQGYIDTRNVESVNSGLILLRYINKDRIFKALHDPIKILRAGRNPLQAMRGEKYSQAEVVNIWRDYIKTRLNLEKTFEGTTAYNPDGTLNIAEADKILEDIANNIIRGKPMLVGRGTGKHEMFFYWKDNQSWLEYNQKYGRGSLLNAIRADIKTSANRIGMAKFFGSNPDAAYNHLATIENEVNPQPNRYKAAAKNTFDDLSGVDQYSVNPKLSTFFGILRGISGTAKLAGRLTILSLPDISNGIMYAHRHGYSYFKAYGTYLSGLFNAIPTEERKYIANLFKELTDSHALQMGRTIDTDGIGAVFNNFNSVLYRRTFMDALDKGNKVSSMLLIGRMLGDNAAKAYSELNEQAVRHLEQFNISAAEWNGIRNKVKKINGKKILSIDAIEELSNEDLRKIYGVQTDMPLYQLKNELHRKLYSVFDVASENVVLTPGSIMRGASTLGTRSGTLAGEILRSVLQFKMYPLSYVDRVLYQGMKNADGVQNKLAFAAMLFGATFPLSWLSNYLDNIGRGKTQPQWEKMNFSEKAAYAKDLLLPGLGFAGSFLNPNSRGSASDVGKYFSTPALQLLYQSMVAPLQIAEGFADGDTKKVKRAFRGIANSVMPGQGIPFVAPYMRLMFGNKPYLESGQKQLYGA